MQHKNSKKSWLIVELIGKFVREKRLELSKSQRILAYEFGVEKSLLNRIENATNETKIISLFTICEMLGVKPSDLLKYVEKELPKDFSTLDE